MQKERRDAYDAQKAKVLVPVHLVSIFVFDRKVMALRDLLKTATAIEIAELQASGNITASQKSVIRRMAFELDRLKRVRKEEIRKAFREGIRWSDQHSDEEMEKEADKYVDEWARSQ